MRITVLVPGVALSLCLAGLAAFQPPEAQQRFPYVRLGALGLAVACGFLFDDRAARLTDVVPSPFLLRRSTRIVVTLTCALTVAGLGAIVASKDMSLTWAITESGMSPLSPMPAGRIVLEACALAILALLIAAMIGRRIESEPGKLVGPVLLGAYAVSWMIPEPGNPWPYPFDERWAWVGAWWWCLLIVSLVGALVLSRDTRRGRTLRR
jgi:hypothetical protein